MSDKHWAIFALRDIKNALDNDRYDVASCHIKDAIDAILSRDDQDFDMRETKQAVDRQTVRTRM
ncbi:MAG: hypothetical protein AB8B62_12785 [Roseobacter sp.]